MTDVKLLMILSVFVMLTHTRRIDTGTDDIDYDNDDEDDDDPLQQLRVFSAKYCQHQRLKNISQR